MGEWNCQLSEENLPETAGKILLYTLISVIEKPVVQKNRKIMMIGRNRRSRVCRFKETIF